MHVERIIFFDSAARIHVDLRLDGISATSAATATAATTATTAVRSACTEGLSKHLPRPASLRPQLAEEAHPVSG